MSAFDVAAGSVTHDPMPGTWDTLFPGSTWVPLVPAQGTTGGASGLARNASTPNLEALGRKADPFADLGNLTGGGAGTASKVSAAAPSFPSWSQKQQQQQQQQQANGSQQGATTGAPLGTNNVKWNSNSAATAAPGGAPAASKPNYGAAAATNAQGSPSVFPEKAAPFNNGQSMQK